MTATRSAYDVLDLAEDATPDDVRRAYRRMALRYHPDRNPGDPTAAEAFLEVQRAYDALNRTDLDAGFDAERVAAQMQRAAEEIERRRSRRGEGGRAWQQVRFTLDRPRTERLWATVRTKRALIGLAFAVGAAVALAVGLVPALALADTWLGVGVTVSPLAAVGIGLAVGAAAGYRVMTTAEPPPYAVETHWQGLRDLRWDVLLSWNEIRGVRQGDGVVDVALTERAARRLHPLVPPSVWLLPHVYQLPLADGSRLVPILEAQLGERAR